MKYLKFFNNIKQYNDDKQNSPEDYAASAVTYVLTDFNKGDKVKYKKNFATNPPSVLWIDDFNDPSWIAQDAGYNNFSDYIDDYIADPSHFGSNKFVFTNETMEYDGEEYFLYEFDEYGMNMGNDTAYYGLLPMNISYQTLYNESMETDYTNRFEPFAYVLNVDQEQYWENVGDGWYVLAKVER